MVSEGYRAHCAYFFLVELWPNIAAALVAGWPDADCSGTGQAVLAICLFQLSLSLALRPYSSRVADVIFIVNAALSVLALSFTLVFDTYAAQAVAFAQAVFTMVLVLPLVIAQVQSGVGLVARLFEKLKQRCAFHHRGSDEAEPDETASSDDHWSCSDDSDDRDFKSRSASFPARLKVELPTSLPKGVSRRLTVCTRTE